MRKLAIFCFAFAAAAALCVWILPSEYLLPLAGAAGAVSLLTLLIRGNMSRRCRIAAFGLAFGLCWSWGYEHFMILPTQSMIRETSLITAQVRETPTATRWGSAVVVKFGRGKAKLWLDCPPSDLSIGDEITVEAELFPVPEGDDSALFYEAKEILTLGYQRGDLTVKRPEKLPLSCIPSYLGDLTQRRIVELFPEDVSGFVRALLTGDRSGLSYEQTNAMSIVGISHVVAVSGMHISLIVAVISYLCLHRRWASFIISSVVMVFFGAMVGFTPSVTRAIVMNVFILLAPAIGMDDDTATTLGFALLLILMQCPWAIANISLQLSFLAVTGIYSLSPRMNMWLLGRLRRKKVLEGSPRWKLSTGIWGILSATISANLATMPLTAAYFGVISLVAPLANLLTSTVLSVVFVVSLAIVLLSVIPGVGSLLAGIVAWPVRYVLLVVKTLGGLPYSAVYTEGLFILLWLGAAYVMIGVFLLGKKKRPVVLCICLIVTLIAGIFLSAGNRGSASVTAFDVGQGQCVLLECDGERALVDCGGDDGDRSGEMVVRKLMTRGIHRIDYLILTHFDMDHTCGTAQLLNRMEVGGIYVADVGEGSANREGIFAAAEAADVPVTVLSMDMQMNFGSGFLKLFVPIEKSEENASLSALMSVKKYDILIVGDMDSGDETRLVKTHTIPDLEVLVAGHHGSRYSTGEVLLRETAPDVVLISVGENSYGHPAQSVLDRIAANGMAVYRTDLDGDITVSR